MSKVQSELEFVNRRFDRDAGVFEDIYKSDTTGFNKWFNRKFRKPIFERFEIALNTVGDARGKKIIDIGCGTGIYMTTLGLRGATKVLGVDFSQKMLDFAAQNIRSMGLEKVCELVREDFLKLDLTEKFDYSLAMGVFDYLPDPVSFLKKLKAVTSGQVIASFPSYSLIRGPLRKLRYLLTTRGNVYFYNKSDIENLLNKAGIANYKLVPLQSGAGYVLIADCASANE